MRKTEIREKPLSEGMRGRGPDVRRVGLEMRRVGPGVRGSGVGMRCSGVRRRGLAAAGILLLAAALAAPDTALARRLPGDQVAAHLVDVALREWRDWGGTRVDATDGTARLEDEGAHESDTAPFDAAARVHRYWALGTGSAGQPGAPPRPDAPWSAAFVSYLMQQIGIAEPAFVGD